MLSWLPELLVGPVCVSLGICKEASSGLPDGTIRSGPSMLPNRFNAVEFPEVF